MSECLSYKKFSLAGIDLQFVCFLLLPALPSEESFQLVGGNGGGEGSEVAECSLKICQLRAPPYSTDEKAMATAPGWLATGHRCEWQGRGKSLFFTVPAFHLLLGLGVREPGGVKLAAAAERVERGEAAMEPGCAPGPAQVAELGPYPSSPESCAKAGPGGVA